ncbi:ASCH domain-containing protein [Patescibacteria group bacterium]
MKQPLYALLIAPDFRMRSDILCGRKAITIRAGHRDYRVGLPVMLCCHEVPWCVMADIAEVKHCRLRDVTSAELQDDGFIDHDDALAGLKRFYPQMTLDSDVTVVRWENLRGALKDRFGGS